MTNGPSASPSPNGEELTQPRQTFPKSNRLLRPGEFRQVYDQGFRVPCRCFVAFCWKPEAADGPKIGFTTPRALGKATKRNRMRRRLRESVRKQLWRLDARWRIVWNLRRAALDAPRDVIDSEVDKVLQRCAA